MKQIELDVLGYITKSDGVVLRDICDRFAGLYSTYEIAVTLHYLAQLKIISHTQVQAITVYRGVELI